jgi:hypothetical protein
MGIAAGVTLIALWVVLPLELFLLSSVFLVTGATLGAGAFVKSVGEWKRKRLRLSRARRKAEVAAPANPQALPEGADQSSDDAAPEQ